MPRGAHWFQWHIYLTLRTLRLAGLASRALGYQDTCKHSKPLLSPLSRWNTSSVQAEHTQRGTLRAPMGTGSPRLEQSSQQLPWGCCSPFIHHIMNSLYQNHENKGNFQKNIFIILTFRGKKIPILLWLFWGFFLENLN